MNPYVLLEKPLGKTPLEVVSAWKSFQGLPLSFPASYAGRLDPMASGKLLVLLGDECRRQKEYTGLDKEYEVEVLLGVGSDTGDVLGVPSLGDKRTLSTKEIKNALLKELGTHEHAYPVFSSKTVNGKPLFLYSLEGTLGTISVPTHKETLYRIKCLKKTELSNSKLKERVEQMLSLAPVSNEPSKLLGADFRIKTIRPLWENILMEEQEYVVLSLRVTCGSGTYMRSLAARIGESLGTKGLALSIRRTKIGTYSPLLGFWTRLFR